MKFTIAKNHRYWWPITVRMPDPDNAGEIVEQKLLVQFEPLPRDELVAAQERATELKTLREIVAHETAQAVRVVRNWEGVIDDAGDPVPFTADLLVQSLQQSWFRKAINDALTASMNGEAAASGN